MPALVLSKVSKRFGGLLAVSDVNMEVPARAHHRPDRAQRRRQDHGGQPDHRAAEAHDRQHQARRARHHQAEAHEVARAGVSRTFQNIRLLPEATVLENVMIGFHRPCEGLAVRAADRPALVARETPQLFERGLEAAGALRHDALRGPPGRRPGLRPPAPRRDDARLATSPQILLLDEPVAGMNDVEAGELGEIFQELARPAAWACC
jgi:branched-chain amino acid transport system ATP-binding protein